MDFDDLFKVVIFVGGIVFALGGRFMKAMREAQGEGEGANPQRPAGQRSSKPAAKARQKPESANSGPVLGEGYSMERENITVAEERERFRHQSEQFRQEHGGRPDRSRKAADEELRGVNLQEALASRDGVVQGLVLAEVLGKPKALRRR